MRGILPLVLEFRVMTALPLMAYLVAAVWAIMESAKRWATFFWLIASLAIAICTLWACSLIWPWAGAILGDVAGILAPLVSAVVGLNHMRKNRRTPRKENK
jgi:hypothetical protein